MALMLMQNNPTMDEFEMEQAFSELDADNSTTLDYAEVNAFLHGKFGLDGSNLRKAFAKHAHKHTKKNEAGDVVQSEELTLDITEFKAMCFQVNAAVKEFCDKEEKLDKSYIAQAQCCGTFACVCCLPTLCCSCVCSNLYLTTFANPPFEERLKTKNSRMNDAIAKGLHVTEQTPDANDPLLNAK